MTSEASNTAVLAAADRSWEGQTEVSKQFNLFFLSNLESKFDKQTFLWGCDPLETERKYLTENHYE